MAALSRMICQRLRELNVGMTDRYQTQIDDIEALIAGLRAEEAAEGAD